MVTYTIVIMTGKCTRSCEEYDLEVNQLIATVQVTG